MEKEVNALTEQPNQPASRRKKRLGLALIPGIILLMAGLSVAIGIPLVRFASEPEHFREWVNGYGFWGRLLYMGMVILQTVVAFIPGEPFEIAGGYAFGAIEGTALCMIAATLGSLAVFLLVRRYGMRLAEVFFSREKLMSLRFLRESSKRDMLFMIIFMIPGTPKDLLCYFAGLTDMRLPVWLLICTLGRVPSVLSSTVGGNALGEGSYLAAVIVFAATALLSACGILFYRRMSDRRTEHKTDANEIEIQK